MVIKNQKKKKKKLEKDNKNKIKILKALTNFDLDVGFMMDKIGKKNHFSYIFFFLDTF